MSHLSSPLSASQYGFLDKRLGVAVALLLGISGIGYALYQGAGSDAERVAMIPEVVATGGERQAGITAPQVGSGASATADAAGVSAEDASIAALPAASPQTVRSGAQSVQSADAERDEAPDQAVQEARDSRFAAPAAAVPPPAADPVIHITNVGDRIVISNDPQGLLQDSVAQSSGSAAAGQIDRDADTGGASGTDSETPEQSLSDYDEVYPGCPRALPPGSDAQMAAERLQLYGCRYLASCNTATEEAEASCTWYLINKI